MHAPQFGIKSKQSSKQPYKRGMKDTISYLKIEHGMYKLKLTSGYISKNGCEWDSNP